MNWALQNISTLSILIPVCCFIGLKPKTTTLKLLFILLLLGVSTEALSYCYAERNLAVYFVIQNCYTTIEASLLLFIYRSELKSERVQQIILGLVLFFFTEAIFRIIIGKFDHLDKMAVLIEYGILIWLGLTFFFQIYADLSIHNHIKYPLFWFNLAILFYTALGLLTFLFRGLFPKVSPTALSVENLYYLSNIIHYVLLGVFLWMAKRI